MEFEVLYYNSRIFRDVFEVLSRSVDELSLRAENGLRVRELDPSHTILMDLHLPMDEFSEYSADGDGEKVPYVNLEHLMKALNRHRDERIGLKTEGNRLLVRYPDTKRTFWIPIEWEKASELLEPKLCLQARLTLHPEELISALKDIESNDFDTVTLTAEEDRVEVSAENEERRYSKVFDREDAAIACNGKQRSRYSLGLLKNILTTKLGPVVLEWASDFPLQVTYQVGRRGMLRFVLAPRIDY